MTKMSRDELMALDDGALEERNRTLESIWNRLERRSDPNGTYTDRQGLIEAEQRIITEILGSRRQP